MSMIQNFKENVLSDVSQFELKKERNEKLYFVKYKNGKATYVFGDSIYRCGTYRDEIPLNAKLSMKAILSDGNIYITDTFMFYPAKAEEYPENVFSFSDKIKELNSLIENELFPKFYDNLPVRSLTENEQEDAKKQVRETILQKNSIVAPPTIEKIMNSENVAKLLTGSINFEEYVNERFNEKKDRFISIKSHSHELKKLVDAKHGVENWEVEMANGLRSLDAKAVNVEFSYNGKCATEKVEKDTLLRKLVNKDYFSSHYFVNGKSGERLLKTLDAGNYSGHEKGVLECKHIQSIKYGKKVVYSVMQFT